MAEHAEVYHIVPIDDTREHFLDFGCWCKPEFNADMHIVHNSEDGREYDEVN